MSEMPSKIYILEQYGRHLPRTNSPFSNPLNIFLGKNVIVEADYNNIVITGRLIHYQIGNRQKPHRPFILILENGQGKHVLRGNFVSISEGAVK